MSVPGGSARNVGQRAVRVKRGSTWMIVAPRSFAFITKRNPTGWFSAKFEPLMTMQSALLQIHQVRRRAAATVEVPRPGTVELCHIRAWFSMNDVPTLRNSFAIT